MAADKAESARDWAQAAIYLVIAGVAGYLIYTVVGAVQTIAKQTAAAVTSVTGAASNTVVGGATLWDNVLSFFGYNTIDTSTIPGYAVGNWNKMMNSGSDNPLSSAYVPQDSSVTNPGPTAVQNNYVTPLDAAFGTFATNAVANIVGIFQQIPTQDLVNLTYSYEKLLNGRDLALSIQNTGGTLPDIIASIIMQKPISQ